MCIRDRHSPVHTGLDMDALAAPEHADGVMTSTEPAAFPSPERTHVAKKGAYELRLVVDRVLYDAGTAISHCPSSAGLAPEAPVQLSPADAAPVGIETGLIEKLYAEVDQNTLFVLDRRFMAAMAKGEISGFDMTPPSEAEIEAVRSGLDTDEAVEPVAEELSLIHISEPTRPY